jgi:DNA invertase Pin-like site-specific DNA recombinase
MYVSHHTSSNHCLRRWRVAIVANGGEAAQRGRRLAIRIEVMTTIRDLGERGIVLRSLREGIDSSNATGRMVAGVLASLAELELELGRERRAAAREARRARGQHIGRPKALDEKNAALAQRMNASGESASTIATTLGVSRATVYRVLAEQDDDAD